MTNFESNMSKISFVAKDEIRQKILFHGVTIFVTIYFLLFFAIKYLYTEKEFIINTAGLLGWIIVICFFIQSTKLANQYSLCKMVRIYMVSLLLGIIAVFIIIRVYYFIIDTSEYSFVNKSAEGILIYYTYALSLRKYALGGAIGLIIGNIYSRK